MSAAPALYRFEKKYMPVPEAGCWLWVGTTQGGYGVFSLRGKPIGAHRASYVLLRGEIPVGLVVRHKCDTPLCVNPEHLVLGTQKQNAMDCIDRGRAVRSRGEKHYKAKLSSSAVVDIRSSTEANVVLAARHHCSRSLVSMIKSGKQRKENLS